MVFGKDISKGSFKNRLQLSILFKAKDNLNFVHISPKLPCAIPSLDKNRVSSKISCSKFFKISFGVSENDASISAIPMGPINTSLFETFCDWISDATCSISLTLFLLWLNIKSKQLAPDIIDLCADSNCDEYALRRDFK